MKFFILMKRTGFFLIGPFMCSLMWISIHNKGPAFLVGAVLGMTTYVLSIAYLAGDIQNENRMTLVFAAWILSALLTTHHHISVTRTTIVITAVIWGIILFEASIRFMKEKIDIALPRGPIA